VAAGARGAAALQLLCPGAPALGLRGLGVTYTRPAAAETVAVGGGGNVFLPPAILSGLRAASKSYSKRATDLLLSARPRACVIDERGGAAGGERYNSYGR
jgi:hypothetical protein